MDNHPDLAVCREHDTIIKEVDSFTTDSIDQQPWFGHRAAKVLFPFAKTITPTVASTVGEEVFFRCTRLKTDNTVVLGDGFNSTKFNPRVINNTIAARYWLDLSLEEIMSAYPEVLRGIGEKLTAPADIKERKAVSFFEEDVYSYLKDCPKSDAEKGSAETQVFFKRDLYSVNHRIESCAYLTIVSSTGYFIWVYLDVPTHVEKIDFSEFLEKGVYFNPLELAEAIEAKYKSENA